MSRLTESQLTVDTSVVDSFDLGSRYDDVTPIGCGGHGVVFSALDTVTETRVAVKSLGFRTPQACRSALREIRILRRLTHENIIRLQSVLTTGGQNVEELDDQIWTSRQLFLVQELFHMDLAQALQCSDFTHAHARFFMYQILRGVKYMHSAHVMHRDMKPSNMLINGDTLDLKIGDFGTARILDPHYDHRGQLTGRLGTSWYRAPEQLLGAECYDVTVDLWACGLILLEMLVGRSVFTAPNDLEQLKLIVDSVQLTDLDWRFVLHKVGNKLFKNHPLYARTPLYERFADLQADALSLALELLRFSPCDRLTAAEALDHLYLQPHACALDEPVALTPLHIEAEVDQLSPTSTQQAIILESRDDSGLSCGSRCDVRVASPPITAARVPDVSVTSQGISASWKEWLYGSAEDVCDRAEDILEREDENGNFTSSSVEEKDGVESSEKALRDHSDVERHVITITADLEPEIGHCLIDLEANNSQWESQQNAANERNSDKAGDVISTPHRAVVRSPLIEDLANVCDVTSDDDDERRKLQTLEPDDVDLDLETVDAEGKILLDDTQGEKSRDEEESQYSDVISRGLSPNTLNGDNLNRNCDIRNIYLYQHLRRRERDVGETNLKDGDTAAQLRAAGAEDFDQIYRLPTEHLNRNRDFDNERIKHRRRAEKQHYEHNYIHSNQHYPQGQGYDHREIKVTTTDLDSSNEDLFDELSTAKLDKNRLNRITLGGEGAGLLMLDYRERARSNSSSSQDSNGSHGNRSSRHYRKGARPKERDY